MKSAKKKTPLSLGRYSLLLLFLFCFCLNGGLFALRANDYRVGYEREIAIFERDFRVANSLSDSHPSEVLSDLFSDISYLVFFNRDPILTHGTEAFLPEGAVAGHIVRSQNREGQSCLLFYSVLEFEDGNRLDSYYMRSLADFDEAQTAQNLVTVLISFVATILLIGGYALLSNRAARITAPSEAEQVPEAAPAEVAMPQARTDLGVLCAELLEALADEAETRQVRLSGSAVRFAWVLGETEALRSALGPILRRLLAEAPAGGTLTLQVWREDTVRLTLSGFASLPALTLYRPALDALGLSLAVGENSLTLHFPLGEAEA